MTDTVRRARPSFAMIPEALLHDQQVTPFAVRLYGVLDRIAKGEEVALPSYAELRPKLAYVEHTTGRTRTPSDEALTKAVAVLEAAGWVTVERELGSSSRYKLLDHPHPVAKSVNQPDQPAGTSRASAVTRHRASAEGPAAPARISKREERTTPLPPASGGLDAHAGQHPNCRACGTSRRPPKPADPQALLAEEQRAAMEANTRRLREQASTPPPAPEQVAAVKGIAAAARERLRAEKSADEIPPVPLDPDGDYAPDTERIHPQAVAS